MSHLVGLDAAQHELIDLVVDESCHSLRHRHPLTVIGCRPAHGTRLVDKKEEGRRCGAGDLRRIGILGLQHLRLAGNENAEIANVGDVFQGDEVVDHHLRLEERLLALVKVEVGAGCHGIEVYLLEVVQRAAFLRAVSRGVAVGEERVVPVDYLRINLKYNGIGDPSVIHCYVHHRVLSSETDANVVLQAIPPVETPRRVASTLLGYHDAFLVAVGPGIEATVFDDRL